VREVRQEPVRPLAGRVRAPSRHLPRPRPRSARRRGRRCWAQRPRGGWAGLGGRGAGAGSTASATAPPALCSPPSEPAGRGRRAGVEGRDRRTAGDVEGQRLRNGAGLGVRHGPGLLGRDGEPDGGRWGRHGRRSSRAAVDDLARGGTRSDHRGGGVSSAVGVPDDAAPARAAAGLPRPSRSSAERTAGANGPVPTSTAVTSWSGGAGGWGAVTAARAASSAASGAPPGGVSSVFASPAAVPVASSARLGRGRLRGPRTGQQRGEVVPGTGCCDGGGAGACGGRCGGDHDVHAARPRSSAMTRPT
jgi:hypothetical protein